MIQETIAPKCLSKVLEPHGPVNWQFAGPEGSQLMTLMSSGILDLSFQFPMLPVSKVLCDGIAL